MTANSGALYRTGTVSVIQGNANVVGVGTSWLSALIAIAIGDIFTLDMKTWYEVVSVNDDLSIDLDRGFEGVTGSDVNYAIIRGTSGTVLTRIAGQIAVQFNQKQLFLDELRTWLNSTNASENVTDSHGISTSITTPSQMEAEHASRVAQVDSLVGSVQAMTKAEFFALAEKRKRDSNGSGFTEWGKHYSYTYNVNEGITSFGSIASTSLSTRLFLGKRANNGMGISRTDLPVLDVNGATVVLDDGRGNDNNPVSFPPAPDGTETYDSATGVSTQHASSNEAFEGLLANGDFRDGNDANWGGSQTGWTINTGGATHTGSGGDIRQLTALEIGKTYNFKFNFTITGAVSNTSVQIRNNALNSSLAFHAASADEKGEVVLKWTATETNPYLRIYSEDDIVVHSVSVMLSTESVVTSRKDFAFLEVWHEKISDKDVVCPLGNVQYGANNFNGLSVGLSTIWADVGYTAFGIWDTTKRGYMARWSTLSSADKMIFIQDPQNNIYIDNGEFIQVRYRIRVIKGLGDNWDNVTPWSPNTYLAYNTVGAYVSNQGKKTTSVDFQPTYPTFVSNSRSDTPDIEYDQGTFAAVPLDEAVAHNGLCFAIPIALVQRRNQGAYHPTYNPNGCAAFRQEGINVFRWYDYPNKSGISSTLSCMTEVENGAGSAAIGYHALTGQIASTFNPDSGRPDGKFYDAIYASDIQDLRMDSKNRPLDELREEWKRKAIAGEVRGYEAVPFLRIAANSTIYQTRTNTYFIDVVADVTASEWAWTEGSSLANPILTSGSVIVNGTVYKVHTVFRHNSATNFIQLGVDSGTTTTVGSSVSMGIGDYQTHQQDEPTWTDIIGDPTNIAATFPNGVEGQWIPEIPDGSLQTFVNNRKVVSYLSREFTNNSGGIWGSDNTDVPDRATNSVTKSNYNGYVILQHYKTKSHFTEDADNSKVYSLGESVYVTGSNFSDFGNILCSSLIDKVATAHINEHVMLTSKSLLASTGVLDTGLWSGGGISHDNISKLTQSHTVKAINYLTERNVVAHLDLVYKEMVWDSGKDSWELMDEAANETYYNGGVYYWTGMINESFNHIGLHRVGVSATATLTSTYWDNYSIVDGKIINGTTGLEDRKANWILWDGNGFGDNNQFEVASGSNVQTDDNGNLVKYGIATIKLNCFLREE